MTRKKIKEEMVKRGESCFDYDLQLNKEGLVLCQREVSMRFNATTIPNLSCCNTTNPVENIWSTVVKYSQGKWLNQNYSTAWLIAVSIAIMGKSSDEHIQSYMENQLGVSTTQQQIIYRERKKIDQERKKKIRNLKNPYSLESTGKL